MVQIITVNGQIDDGVGGDEIMGFLRQAPLHEQLECRAWPKTRPLAEAAGDGARKN